MTTTKKKRPRKSRKNKNQLIHYTKLSMISRENEFDNKEISRWKFAQEITTTPPPTTIVIYNSIHRVSTQKPENELGHRREIDEKAREGKKTWTKFFLVSFFRSFVRFFALYRVWSIVFCVKWKSATLVLINISILLRLNIFSAFLWH